MILLDTHVALWLTSDPSKLSAKAKASINDARKRGDALALSCISLLELATFEGQGRIEIGISLESLLQEIEAHFRILPISGTACARTLGLPSNFLRDPADRIIAATALVEGLSLATADRQIQRSNALRTIW